MKPKVPFWLILSGLVVAALIGGAALRLMPSKEIASSFESEEKRSATVKPVEKRPLNEVLGIGEDEMVEVGGVQRPKSDVDFEKGKREPVVSKKSPFAHPGHAPAAKVTANEEVKQLFDELAQGKDAPAAARSAMFLPAKFKLDEYEQNPKQWLSKIRPGRVFQPAQPEEGVKPISTKTAGFHRVLQGEKVILEAVVEPNAPVSFYTPQLGFFENDLKSQSVAADENGVARVVYTAGPGTNGVVDILAASPLHSGQLRYRVSVSLPQSN